MLALVWMQELISDAVDERRAAVQEAALAINSLNPL